MFSETFVAILIHLSLVWTGLGAIALLLLLARDFKNKNIW